MFSGLTNQVSSLWSAAKGDHHDENVPTPPNSAALEPVIEQNIEQPPVEEQHQMPGSSLEEGDKKLSGSPTKAGGMFSNVSSKMTGWLGHASMPTVSMPSMPTVSMPSMPAMPSMPSIPGLRKNNAGEENGGIANEGLVTSPDQAQPAEQQLIEGANDDDDRSRYISATGGADSRPASGPTTPTEEQAGIGQVTHKVTAGAKSFGSFLYSSINKAGAKISETVKHNPILEGFNKEQDAFIRSQAGGGGSGVCPWVGHGNDDQIKEEILGLSADRRNFVRAPPAGVEFEFDYDTSYPIALAIMAEDKQLEQMRFELVPKIITEENFWRNYFYRVSLIIQAGDLGTLGGGDEFVKRTSSEDNEVKESIEKSPQNDKLVESVEKSRTNETEFVSDTFQTNDKDLEEVKEGMKKLGIDTLASEANEEVKKDDEEKTEEQWEKDLEAELQDYEVVNDGNNTSSINWEKDVDDLLDDCPDLK